MSLAVQLNRFANGVDGPAQLALPVRVAQDCNAIFSVLILSASKRTTDLGLDALKLKGAYQDEYLEAGGMPVNMMEVLAVTLVFERRVVGQYVAHSKAADLKAPIKATLDKIMGVASGSAERRGSPPRSMMAAVG